MTPGTELPLDLCAGIGPLQLGVVLVYLKNFIVVVIDTRNYLICFSDVHCFAQRAALLKSMLNFMKKAIPDMSFADSIRHCELLLILLFLPIECWVFWAILAIFFLNLLFIIICNGRKAFRYEVVIVFFVD